MRIVKVIIVMLLSMVLFTGCSGCETPQTVYLIGEEYTFETIKVKLENDEAKEQFVLYYEVLAQDENVVLEQVGESLQLDKYLNVFKMYIQENDINELMKIKNVINN